MQNTKKVSSNGLSEAVYAKRNKHIIDLNMNGWSSFTILKKINEMAESEGWRPIKLRTVQYVTAKYFRKNAPDPSDDFYLREAALTQMENDIDNLLTYIQTRETGGVIIDPVTGEEHYREGQAWAPFEYPQTIKLLFKMRMDYLRLRGSLAPKLPSNPKLKMQITASPLLSNPKMAKVASDLTAAIEYQREREEESDF